MSGNGGKGFSHRLSSFRILITDDTPARYTISRRPTESTPTNEQNEISSACSKAGINIGSAAFRKDAACYMSACRIR